MPARDVENADRKARRRSRSRVEIAHDLPLSVLEFLMPNSSIKMSFFLCGVRNTVPVIIEIPRPISEPQIQKMSGPNDVATSCLFAGSHFQHVKS